MGSRHRTLSLALYGTAVEKSAALLHRLIWLSIAPFGLPVVPDV